MNYAQFVKTVTDHLAANPELADVDVFVQVGSTILDAVDPDVRTMYGAVLAHEHGRDWYEISEDENSVRQRAINEECDMVTFQAIVFNVE